MYMKNLQVVATEMFKVCGNISLPIMEELFQLGNNDCNLRQFSQFNLPNVRSVSCGTESILFLGPQNQVVSNSRVKKTEFRSFRLK